MGASPKAAAILDTPCQMSPARVRQLPEDGPDVRMGRVLMRYSLRKLGLAVVCTCIGLSFVGAQARAENEESRCLSLEEVHGGYPRYHIVDGRRCWYASTRGAPQRAPAEAKTKPAEVDINPYDDPIWQEPEPAKVQPIAVRARNCEEQALKLDVKEKRAFMKQCMSN